MGVSKVIYGGKTLIDLTADTVAPDKMLKDYTAHGADGEPIVGTCTFDADTQDATANENEILEGEIAYVRGVRVVGKMKNNGAVNGSVNTKDGVYPVPQGFHDGSGTVGIAESEKAKLVPSNIRQGVTVLGVEGTMNPREGEKGQAKTVTPSTAEQTIVPDEGFTCLTTVTVSPIPYVESDNAAGGKTVKVG